MNEQPHKLTKKEKKEIRKLEYQEELQKEEKQKLFKQIGMWAGVVAVIIISILGLIKLSSTPPPSSDNTIANVPKVTDKDMATGDKKAKVVLVEYSDFQCPACAFYYPIVKQVTSEFKDKILFAYRFFPLTQVHKNAMIASSAGYAAGLQGKFWEMHDMLFDNQTKWSDLSSSDVQNTFISYAESLKLDTNKFKKDMEAESTKNFINDQENAGVNIGVNSTPTFYLNNKKIKPANYEEFKQLIQAELK